MFLNLVETAGLISGFVNCENGLWWYRKMHSEECLYLYYSPHIRAIRSTSIWLWGLVDCVRITESSCSCWFKKMEES